MTSRTRLYTAAILLTAPPSSHALPCADAPGDVTGDGNTDVIDVQCAILLTLAALGGLPPGSVACLGAAPTQGDLDCDGALSVSDVQIAILSSLGAPLPPALDAGGDGCVDACAQWCQTDADCDDGDLCTEDLCDPTTGCANPPLCCEPPAGSCALGYCDPASGCVSVPAWCSPPLYVWAFGGTAGDVIDLPLQIAAAPGSDGVVTSEDFATGIQFSLSYEPTEFQLLGIFSDVCFGDQGCFDLSVSGAGSFPLQTGHSVSTSPSKVPEAYGALDVLIVNLADPSVPLSASWVESLCDDQLVLDPRVLRVRVKLLTTGDKTLYLNWINAVGSPIQTLQTSWLGDGLIHTWYAGSP
jgi:hypothetical protein